MKETGKLKEKEPAKEGKAIPKDLAIVGEIVDTNCLLKHLSQ
nr:hypothetical protein [Mycoplasmopsis bovis]